ncbi:MAG: ABC transporter permease [Gammaproteobacteria bacterium]
MGRTLTFRLRETLVSLAAIHVIWQRAPARRVFLKQLYFSGIQALPLVLVVGIAVAGILTGQLRNFGQSPREALEILLAITNDELAPLVTAVVVSARSAPAMASELAGMQASGEIRLLARLGIPPLTYLVVPRVVAMMAGCCLLSVYFAFAATLSGALFVAGVHAPDVLLVATESLGVERVLLCITKSLFFGAAIALVACHTGLQARGAATDVPIAASRAVVRSFALVMLIDLLMVKL